MRFRPRGRRKRPTVMQSVVFCTYSSFSFRDVGVVFVELRMPKQWQSRGHRNTMASPHQPKLLVLVIPSLPSYTSPASSPKTQTFQIKKTNIPYSRPMPHPSQPPTPPDSSRRLFPDSRVGAPYLFLFSPCKSLQYLLMFCRYRFDDVMSKEVHASASVVSARVWMGRERLMWGDLLWMNNDNLVLLYMKTKDMCRIAMVQCKLGNHVPYIQKARMRPLSTPSLWYHRNSEAQNAQPMHKLRIKSLVGS
jgi:hypothetical protein